MRIAPLFALVLLPLLFACGQANPPVAEGSLPELLVTINEDGFSEQTLTAENGLRLIIVSGVDATVTMGPLGFDDTFLPGDRLEYDIVPDRKGTYRIDCTSCAENGRLTITIT